MPISQRQLEERKMRQDRILDGALNVFKSKGLEGATMDEIANASGFGKGTLYYYFKSKELPFTGYISGPYIETITEYQKQYFIKRYIEGKIINGKIQ